MSRFSRRLVVQLAALSLLALALPLAPSTAQQAKPQKRVGFQGTKPVTPNQKPAIYVEQVKLTEVFDRIGPSLNIGAVVANDVFAAGLQKAADDWGLNLDLFVIKDATERRDTVQRMVDNLETLIIVDSLPGEDWAMVKAQAEKAEIPFRVYRDGGESIRGKYSEAMDVIRAARAELLPRIPKYDEILPIAFPISPMPDSFFQASKFPYPKPLVRVERTAESVSATVHAHTSCNMVAQTGNMLHRTSSIDPNIFLMGMEGGNLSLLAMPGAVDPEKISAVMTSWVLAIRGETSKERDILVENDGVGTSFFKPAIHAPEELDVALEVWKQKGLIKGYQRVNTEEVLLRGWNGADRLLRAGMFLVSSDRHIDGPQIVGGVDAMGRLTLEFHSTQSFMQQFAEITPPGKPRPPVSTARSKAPSGTPGTLLAGRVKPHGGILTEGGTSVGNTVGMPLASILQEVRQPRPDFQPYVMAVEGGFFVVTPEKSLTRQQLQEKIKRVDLDLRGPLTSCQTILVTLADGSKVIFRRTVINFSELDEALAQLRTQGLLLDWKYEGSRGRGLNANVVLTNFLGKHRKFMSSLCTWPNEQRPSQPSVRFYVDGMQRLNFTFITKGGWRQEFVEVPLQVPPVPRDVDLYSGVSELP